MIVTETNNSNDHFLYPATLFFKPVPYLIKTILGSCVAVCLYDPVKKIGGMNHYMLPYWNGQGLASPKYGNIAIEKLIKAILDHGSHKGSLKAKIFGGGEVIDTQISNFRIGERNIQVAHDILEEMNIPIIGESTGGKKGRKIQFNTADGSVRQKYVERSVVPDNFKPL